MCMYIYNQLKGVYDLLLFIIIFFFILFHNIKITSTLMICELIPIPHTNIKLFIHRCN